MERCFTGVFFPLDIPLCGELETGTGLEFAVLGPPTEVPTEVRAWDEGTLPVFLEPDAVSFDRKRSGGGEGDRDSLHKSNL
jgi:hypothetical protein